jgi:hypothetical protein
MADDQPGLGPDPDNPPDALGYDVGYAKPPVATRFKPGRSGNPKGRPRGKGSLAQSLRKALFGKISVTENGKVKSMSALDAIVKSMRLKALKGDVRATALLVKLMEVHKVAAEPEPTRVIQIRFIKPDPARIAEFEKEK